MTDSRPKYAGFKPMLKVSVDSSEHSAVHRDQSLGCVLGSAAGDVAGSGNSQESEFGPATSLSIVEALAYIEAGAVEATRPVLFDKLQEWYTSLDKSDWSAVAEMVVGVNDPRGFEGAAERLLAAFPESFCNSSVVSRVGFSAARWLHAQDVGATQYVGRRLCGVTHANPRAMEVRALLQAIVRWQRSADRDPRDPALDLEHALARAIPEYRGLVEAVFTPGTPATWSSDGAWRCLSNAVDVVRTTASFEDAISAALDVPDETRSVATVVGAIAGARYGASEIPSGSTAAIQGDVLGVHYKAEELETLHARLLSVPSEPPFDDSVIKRIKADVRAGVPISPSEERFLRRFGFDSVIAELDARRDFP